jgi:hypothetical protein
VLADPVHPGVEECGRNPMDDPTRFPEPIISLLVLGSTIGQDVFAAVDIDVESELGPVEVEFVLAAADVHVNVHQWLGQSGRADRPKEVVFSGTPGAGTSDLVESHGFDERGMAVA